MLTGVSFKSYYQYGTFLKPTTITVYNRDDAQYLILSSKIRFNTYDIDFMRNIRNKYVGKKRPLSEKQNQLWESIIYKYRRQFSRMEINYEDLLNLEWKLPILTKRELESKNIFEIFKKGSEIWMRLAFKFDINIIKSVRAIIYDDEHQWLNIGRLNTLNKNKYQFDWDPNNYEWCGPFNSHLFCNLYKIAKKYNINIGPAAESFMALQYNKYGHTNHWRVQIVISNNHIYINNINESLYIALDGIDFTDLSAENMYYIANTFGIDVFPKIIR